MTFQTSPGINLTCFFIAFTNRIEWVHFLLKGKFVHGFLVMYWRQGPHYTPKVISSIVLTTCALPSSALYKLFEPCDFSPCVPKQLYLYLCTKEYLKNLNSSLKNVDRFHRHIPALWKSKYNCLQGNNQGLTGALAKITFKYIQGYEANCNKKISIVIIRLRRDHYMNSNKQIIWKYIKFKRHIPTVLPFIKKY